MQKPNKLWDGRVRSFTEVTLYDAFMESAALDERKEKEKKKFCKTNKKNDKKEV